MGIGRIIKQALRTPSRPQAQAASSTKPQSSFQQDIYFTSNFHAKAREWGLTEDHARHVYYEGDPVPGKENMKVAKYKGEELGIYAFHDRLTNQPVITSIWKRTPRGTRPNPPKSRQ